MTDHAGAHHLVMSMNHYSVVHHCYQGSSRSPNEQTNASLLLVVVCKDHPPDRSISRGQNRLDRPSRIGYSDKVF